MFQFKVDYTSAQKIQEALLSITTVINGEQNSKILRKVGNAYLGDTLKRFENQHDPDRKPWKKLSQYTIDYKRKGRFKGRSIDRPERIGVWTGELISSLEFIVKGNSVFIGTNVEHAPWFHYGVTKFKRLGENQYYPWGPQPSRRFLGRNTRIDNKILTIVGNELERIMGIKPGSTKSAV